VPPFQPKLTAVAGKAMDFATLFNTIFGIDTSLPPYRIELTTPSGPSTAGGKLALQHIRLTPSTGGPAIVIGSANPATFGAEIRTFRHLAELHAQRFKGAQLPLDQERYRLFVARLQGFLISQGFRVVMVDLSQPSLAPATAPPAVNLMAIWIAVALLLVGAIVFAVALVLRARHAI
jgi:hypothetical protein